MKDARHTVHDMKYELRPMEARDATQAAQMEKDAFPTQRPFTSFRRELHNKIARYLVAWEPRVPQAKNATPPLILPNHLDQVDSRLHRIFRKIRHFWSQEMSDHEACSEYLVGYVGLWFISDEAHITAIGVRTPYRGNGIGELLILGSIELAILHSARIVTLEVRASNHIAQALYRKYGFEEAGIRRGYYTDNREDALIMTTSPINTLEYRDHFQHLLHAHEEKWGVSVRRIGS